MNLKKLDERDMPLLNRKRVNFMIEFSGPTPNKKDILKDISTNLKTKEDLIAIRHIYQKFGLNKAKVIVNVYNKVEDLKDFEPKKKKVEAQKEVPKQEVKPETKKEVKQEVKEEPKQEAKEEVKQNGKEESKE